MFVRTGDGPKMKTIYNHVTGKTTTEQASKLLFQQAKIHSITSKKVPYMAK